MLGLHCAKLSDLWHCCPAFQHPRQVCTVCQWLLRSSQTIQFPHADSNFNGLPETPVETGWPVLASCHTHHTSLEIIITDSIPGSPRVIALATLHECTYFLFTNNSTVPVINRMDEETEAQRAMVTCPRVHCEQVAGNHRTVEGSRHQGEVLWKEVLWDDLAFPVLQENKAACIQLVCSKSTGGRRMVK